MRVICILVPIFLCIFLSINQIEGWTHLCPQTHLQMDCKCMPGEKCCFCPKPKMVISHQDAVNGVSEIGNSASNPCEPLVIPNGCTKGGTCPPCQGRYSLERKYTNDICIDDPSCVSMVGFGLPQFATVCSQFADVRRRCPVSCGDCYNDNIDCHGALINDVMCSAFAHIRLKCAHTCAAGPIVKIPGPVVATVIPGTVPVVDPIPVAPAGPPPDPRKNLRHQP